MEGIGSRLGRVSSRYGPAATVFNGPVRKWKKKSFFSAAGPRFLRSSEADGAAALPDEPPRRKFRYTPIAVLEEQRNAELRSVKDEIRTKEMDQSAAKTATVSNEAQGELNVNEIFKEESQEKGKILNSLHDVGKKNLDLALCLNGQNQDSAGKSS